MHKRNQTCKFFSHLRFAFPNNRLKPFSFHIRTTEVFILISASQLCRIWRPIIKISTLSHVYRRLWCYKCNCRSFPILLSVHVQVFVYILLILLTESHHGESMMYFLAQIYKLTCRIALPSRIAFVTGPSILTPAPLPHTFTPMSSRKPQSILKSACSL